MGLLSAPVLVIALGLFSAVTLALANVSVKLSADIMVGRALLSTSAALMIAPFALIVPLPDAATWQVLMIGIPVHFGYQLCLIAALERGDLSLVFPVMRGSAPLLTAIAAAIFLDEWLGPIELVGLFITTAAVIGFAWPPRGVAMHLHPDRIALIFAGMTAIGIALYNVVDARGVRVAPMPGTFIVWVFLLDCICINIYAMARRRGQLMAAARAQWRLGVLAGGLSILSFGAALYGYSLTETSKISALRETAVVFAVLFGSTWLSEGFGARRIICALVMVAGLGLMQFG